MSIILKFIAYNGWMSLYREFDLYYISVDVIFDWSKFMKLYSRGFADATQAISPIYIYIYIWR